MTSALLWFCGGDQKQIHALLIDLTSPRPPLVPRRESLPACMFSEPDFIGMSECPQLLRDVSSCSLTWYSQKMKNRAGYCRLQMRGLPPSLCAWHERMPLPLSSSFFSGRKYPLIRDNLSAPACGGDLQAADASLVLRERSLFIHPAYHPRCLCAKKHITSSQCFLSITHEQVCRFTRFRRAASSCYYLHVATLKHTQVISHTGSLFIFSHTHTHHLLFSPHLSQIFLLSLQLISRASSLALLLLPSAVRCLSTIARMCPYARSQMHTIHSPSFTVCHPEQPSVG